MRVIPAILLAFFLIASSAQAATTATYGSTGAGPYAVAIDATGNVYTANNTGNSISKITPGGASSVIAATGNKPMDLALDSQGNLYTNNSSGNSVSKIFSGGGSLTLAATGTSPYSIAIDSEGDIYTPNSNSDNVSKIFPGGAVATWPSTGTSPWSSVIDSRDNLFVGNWVSQTITRFSPSGSSSTYASLAGSPRALIIDNNSTIYSASATPSNSAAVEKVTSNGASSVLTSLPCRPSDIVIDSNYNIYAPTYSCSGNIYKIEPNGSYSVLARAPVGTFSYGITLDGNGNLFTTDFYNNSVAKVTPSTPAEIAPAPPDVPTAPLAIAGVESATVSVAANPTDARYGAPSSYTISALEDPQKSCTAAPSASCEINNLQGGKPYKFVARANLNDWQSSASLPSSPVIPKERYLLSVQKSGMGEVSSTPGGINCGSACSALFTEGETVSLEAAAAPGWEFIGWSGGGCSGEGACQAEMSQSQSVSALFKQTFSLSVQKSGLGVVASYPAGISCGADCQSLFPSGTVVELVAWPETGYIFQGWSGDCQGQEVCQVTMNEPLEVEALFALAVNHPLSVQRSGSGSGRVVSLPAGISCGQDCSHQFLENTPVTLKAEASPGSVFTGWSGACSGTGDCSLTIDAAKNAIATFTAGAPPPGYVNLSVNKSGDGSGVVSSSQINCGDICNYYFPVGSAVTLNAKADSGSEFQGWSGSCTGLGSCTLLLTESVAVNAAFASDPPQPGFYSVSTLKEGEGTVVSNPLGINCGQTCATDFAENTEINLGATPSQGSVFSGWSNPCQGTGYCSFLLTESFSVAAYFTKRHSLEVILEGSGEVISEPAGIDCNPDCSADFAAGTVVSLRAEAGVGAKFSGWQGACFGTGTCQVTMDSSKEVRAVFTQTFPLQVARRGSGEGSISSTPLGIDCGDVCNYSFDEGQIIALHAQALAGSRFKEWQGACQSDPCRVTLNQAQSVEAVFTRNISMKVKSIKRKISSRRAALISKIYVSDPGEIVQRATKGKTSWCRAKKRATRAGTYTLHCKIKKKYLKKIAKKKVRLRVQSSFSAYEESVSRQKDISLKAR